MRIATLAATLLLAACAGAPPIIVSHPGDISPAELRTFEFRSSEAALAAGHRARDSDAQLAETITHQLAAKGYEPAAPGTTADFVMTYRVAVFTSENPRDAYAQVRDPTSLIGRDVAPDPAGSEGLVRETTLVLMALAGTDEKVIWQATASGVATGPQELASGAIRAANAMLDRFPHRGR